MYRIVHSFIHPLLLLLIPLWFYFLFCLIPRYQLPFLYVGMELNAHSIEHIKHLGITHIVNCAIECKNKFERTPVIHYHYAHQIHSPNNDSTSSSSDISNNNDNNSTNNNTNNNNNNSNGTIIKYLRLDWEDNPAMQFTQIQEVVAFIGMKLNQLLSI